MPDGLNINLIPWPASVRLEDTRCSSAETSEGGSLLLTHLPRVRWEGVRTARLETAVERLMGGLDLPPVSTQKASRTATLGIFCESISARFPQPVENASYVLQTTSEVVGIRLKAATEWGILSGLATLKQLIWSVRSAASGKSQTYNLPRLSIADKPSSTWRGLMLDVARHFMSIDVLHDTLEAMAFYKFNVLHLHLSDDQGFRFPSAAYPRLVEIGGEDGAYTRDELTQLVTHASQLGIRLVPELDVPGHCSSWLAAYPEWSAEPAEDRNSDNARKRAGKGHPSTQFGPHQACLDPTNPSVYQALETLFGEVVEIFPDPCVHIGGDEVAPQWWRRNQNVVEMMAARGLDDVADVQNYFNRHVIEYLEGQGRTVVAWDEAMHPDLPVSVIIQSWRCARSRNLALQRGFPVIFSSGYYLDLFYPADLHYGFLPDASEGELLAQEKRLIEDPRLQHIRSFNEWLLTVQNDRQASWQVAPEQWGSCLGGEACLWSELVCEEILPLRLWSRAAAIGESLWSGKKDSIDALYVRMEASWPALTHWTGVSIFAAQQAMIRQLKCSQQERQALELIFSLTEPVKGYSRLLGDQLEERLREGLQNQNQKHRRRVEEKTPATRSYDTSTPLNRIVDLVSPESLLARKIGNQVNELIAAIEYSNAVVAPAGTAAVSYLQAAATAWQHQLPFIRHLARRSDRVTQVLPLAEELACMGADLNVLLAYISKAFKDHPHAEKRALEESIRGELDKGLSERLQSYAQGEPCWGEMTLAPWTSVGRLVKFLTHPNRKAHAGPGIGETPVNAPRHD